jgi:hypothetical protein
MKDAPSLTLLPEVIMNEDGQADRNGGLRSVSGNGAHGWAMRMIISSIWRPRGATEERKKRWWREKGTQQWRGAMPRERAWRRQRGSVKAGVGTEKRHTTMWPRFTGVI